MAYVYIAAKDLKPGMYIVQTGESWRDRPYLYAKPGIITNEAEVATIIKQGFREAYYDPERSTTADPPPEERPVIRTNDGQATSLAEELVAQSERYIECVEHAKRIMEAARSGHVEVKSSRPMVQNIIESVGRNPDALVTLTKIRSHDEYTYAHSVNVSILAVAFGRHLGIEGEELMNLGLTGLFHDIGKMRIPTSILQAPRRLTQEEFTLMKKHVQYGLELLAGVSGLSQDIIDGVGDHHERYNGKGYPNQKKWPEMSRFGRLVAICDVYDALSSVRVYHAALAPSRALAMMFGMRDDAWEGEVLEHFVKMIGIYPVGTPIALTGGFKGVVVKSNIKAPLYPSVVLCYGKDGKAIDPPLEVDLSKQQDYQIIKQLSPDAFACDVYSLLSQTHNIPKPKSKSKKK